MDCRIVANRSTTLSSALLPRHSSCSRKPPPSAPCLRNWPLLWAHLAGDMSEEPFRDRKEAGQRLGRELSRLLSSDQQLQHEHAGTPEAAAAQAALRSGNVVVLGLVRGGMPVADAVARALGCPCDAFVVRKVGAPDQPEYGIGAVAENGMVVINSSGVEDVGATQQQLQDIIDSEVRELQRRVQVYRGGRPHLPVAGKAVILVDDGLATGVTARAACKAMRAAGAAVTVLALPVGAARTIAEFQKQHVADLVVCLRTPKRFRAVGAHFADFSQTTDEEVVAILKQHAQNSSHQPPAAEATAAAAAAVAEPAGAETSAQQAPGGATTPTPGTVAKVGSKAAAATTAAGTSHLAVDTAAVRDQAAGSSHNPPAMTPAAPTTPKTAAARTSSLAAALNHSPGASPTAAAAAAAPVQRLRPVEREEVVITDSELGVQLHGILTVPEGALGLVVFAHGSGSSRNSPRNNMVAATLQKAGLATLLFDLLSEHEAQQRHNVFDIALLAGRLQLAVEWLESDGTPAAGRVTPDFPVGFFGASTGGGAALWAAAYLGTRISAVVVRGGRPDLASAKLPAVTAPALLLVGSEDTHVLELNNEALQEMGSSDSSQVVVVPGAGHLFEGPGQLEHVAELAVEWFRAHMGPQGDE